MYNLCGKRGPSPIDFILLFRKGFYMGNFHLVFLPLLIVMALLSLSIRKKLKRLLLQKEGEFCKSISLSKSMLADSLATSLKLVLLIVFNVNKNHLTDFEVLNVLKKAKIIDLSYYAVFLVYLIFIAKSFGLKLIGG